MKPLIITVLSMLTTCVAAEWTVHHYVDEFGDPDPRWGKYATTPPVKSERRLSFPWSDLEAALVIPCGQCVVLISRSDGPTCGRPRLSLSVAAPYRYILRTAADRHTLPRALLKFDDGEKQAVAANVSPSGRKTLLFRPKRRESVWLNNRLRTAKTLRIAIEWHDGETAVFRFDLTGLSAHCVRGSSPQDPPSAAMRQRSARTTKDESPRP